MKAPDKVYVYIPQRLNMSTFKEDTKYIGMAYIDKKSTTPSQIEEYIRKDALLEWAEKKIAKGTIDEWDKGYVQCLKDLIENLNHFADL